MKLKRAVRLSACLVAAVLPLSTVTAGQINAVINGKSYHLDASTPQNESNYGFGLEYQFDSQSRWRSIVMVNGFRDSNDNLSYMAGAGIHRTLLETERLSGLYVDAGLNAFLMTREDVNDNRPFPGMLPSMTVGNRYMGFNVTYLPRKAVEKIYSAKMLDRSIDGIVFVQFKVNISRVLGID